MTRPRARVWAHPQAARIDALGEHEALGLLEAQRQGDLAGSERLDARRRDDARASGERWNLGRNLPEGADAAVGEGYQLDVHLGALGRRQVGDEPHRAVEHYGQIDLAVAIGHLDHINQPLWCGWHLGRCDTGAERSEQAEEPAPPALLNV